MRTAKESGAGTYSSDLARRNATPDVGKMLQANWAREGGDGRSLIYCGVGKLAAWRGGAEDEGEGMKWCCVINILCIMEQGRNRHIQDTTLLFICVLGRGSNSRDRSGNRLRSFSVFLIFRRRMRTAEEEKNHLGRSRCSNGRLKFCTFISTFFPHLPKVESRKTLISNISRYFKVSAQSSFCHNLCRNSDKKLKCWTTPARGKKRERGAAT